MFQETLYPCILEKTLDELTPKLREILYCQNPTFSLCHYCESGENNIPCKYLLVDPLNLIEIINVMRESWELRRKATTIEEFEILNKKLERLFSDPLYSLADNKDFLIYLKTGILDLDRIKKKAKEGEREAVKGRAGRFVVRLASKLEKKYNVIGKIPGNPIEALSYFSFLGERILSLSENSLLKMIEWYKKDKRLEEIKKLANFVHATGGPKKLKGKERKVGNRRITWFTDYELNFWLKRLEETRSELDPSGCFTLTNFFNYSNPIQKYSLLKKQEADLGRRIEKLGEELNRNISELRNLEKLPDFGGKSPIKTIMSIPNFCYQRLDKTIIKILEKVGRRKSAIVGMSELIKKKNEKRKKHNKKNIKLREWLYSVDLNNLERELKETRKISKTLEELNERRSLVSGELTANFSQISVQPQN